MIRPRLLCLPGLVWSLLAAAAGAESLVVLRTDPGRFLRPDAQGVLRPQRAFPDAEETFRLVAGDSGQVALRHPRGWVVSVGPAGSPRLGVRPEAAPPPRPAAAAEPASGPALAEPVPPEAWLVMEPRAGNRAVLRPGAGSPPIRFAPPPKPATTRTDAPGDDAAGGLDAGQSIDLYRVGQIPEGARTVLAAAIQALLAQELVDREYDKTRRRKKEEFIKLPAPTLSDPGRTRRHRVLGTDEETRIQARLDGQPTLAITHMPYLSGYCQPREGAVLFVVRAELPAAGRVGYTIPRAMSVSTGYRARVRLVVVGQIIARRDGEKVSLDPPEVLDVEVQLLSLDLSNDLLNSARTAIRHAINEELQRKEPRIRQQANKSIGKAVDTREFRLPLLRFLLEPEGAQAP